MATLFAQDLETDTTGLSLVGAAARSTNYANSGSYSLLLGGFTGGSASFTVNFPVAGTFKLWYLFRNGGGTAQLTVRMNGSPILSVTNTNPATDEVWVEFDYSVGLSGSKTFSIEGGANDFGDDPVGVYIDDILVEAGPADDLELTRVTETDTAQALGANVEHAIGQATETDTAQSLAATEDHALARVSETDTAQTLGATQSKALGRVVETDTAQTLGVSVPTSVALPRVTVGESARPLTYYDGEVYYLGRVSESDSVAAMTPVVPITHTLGRVIETGTARALAVNSRSMLRTFHRYLCQH